MSSSGMILYILGLVIIFVVLYYFLNPVRKPIKEQVIKNPRNTTCNICLGKLKGDIYKCYLCPNYNLCGECRHKDVKGEGKGHVLERVMRVRPKNCTIVGTKLIFIHIPKNAGTWFSINYLEKRRFGSHLQMSLVPPRLRENTVAIIRNPYDRMVSMYNFSIIPTTHFHSLDNKDTGAHITYHQVKNMTFDEYVEGLYSGTIPETFTTMPQLKFISVNNKDNHCPNIIRYEHLEEDIKRILHLPLKGKKVNKASKKAWQDYYTTQKSADLVYKMYRMDFEALGYSRLFLSH